MNELIFALDVDEASKAKAWVDRLLKVGVISYKVGLQLFLASHFEIIDYIVDKGCNVMVDLKLFDIPETVKLAVKELTKHKATFITVHGNDAALRAAIEVRGESKILAVTVLTSFDEQDMRQLGLTGSIADLVYLKAKRCLELGCDGIVSSGLEVSRLRQTLDINGRLLTVTPGIRPGTNTEDDQRRVATAYDAMKNGASHIVVGRPIRDSKDPERTVLEIIDQIAQGKSDRIQNF